MATGSRSAHPTRQARRRAATYDEIVRAARTLLAHGQELTVRGVATRMGSSPAGLYRYVANLDELRDLVAAAIDESLALDVQTDLAHLPAFDTTARWLAAWTALRRWGLARPEEFRMLLARPRSEGAPVRELSDALLGRLLHALCQQHDLPLPPLPTAAESGFANGVRAQAEAWPTELRWLHARVCASLHGVIALEVTGYVDPALVASASLYRSTVIDWLARLGQAGDFDRLMPLLDDELGR
ncbi:TetR/AcrR family transcriptional regulator [Nocardioides sp.]|uniref:TetR/AcrR family transcriptional regulator n=1 Tax=Nocardioides sp. TaxID=35761 RepID=UPI002C6AC639|nr:WHG domain-containing protein [Nocardioides sp.]HSX66217.1 WHG domain-containing protein [Nocardioides sp.]